MKKESSCLDCQFRKEAEKYHELGLSSITTNCPGRIKKHLSNSTQYFFLCFSSIVNAMKIMILAS